MAKGKLIIIESGSDASGKATQSNRLYERLINEGKQCMKITFPDYNSDSSALVKMYLNGDFGKDPNDVNPYVSSTFYAVDRYASYKTEWQEFYLEGGIILADRYTTSNMIHQSSKIADIKERQRFLNWLENLEYDIYGLPRPTTTIFMNMPPNYSNILIEKRDNKITGKAKKDIHESNLDYLAKSYKSAIEIAKDYQWPIINCVENDQLLSIDAIHERIYIEIRKELNKGV